MEKQINYVGIDISKMTFDVAISSGKGFSHHKFPNAEDGFESLLSLLCIGDHCVMEASGPYYLRLATFLFEQDIAVSVVNPLVIRRFSQMRLFRSKTDKKDAQIIAQYGAVEQPARWSAEDPHILELRQMQAFLSQIEQVRTDIERQQQAFTLNTHPCPEVIEESEELKRNLLQKAARVEKRMHQIIKEHYQEQLAQLTSIPGIGIKTAISLIIISAGFTKFQNAKQLSSYVGLCPRIFESGTSVKGRARICKMGMGRIRKLLYLCALSAKKANRACREMFDRLVAKGKPKMLALIAVANKLLRQAFAVSTKQKYYNENSNAFSCI